MHIFSKYKERFVPNSQSDMLNIIRNDEKMFQEYKEAFKREKIDGVCGYLCYYAKFRDSLAGKETFLRDFKDESLLIHNLIESVKNGNVVSNVEREQEFNDVQDKMEKLRADFKVKIKKSKKSFQEILLERLKDVNKEYKEFCNRGKIKLKKPEMLTIINCASLSAIDSGNNYKEIHFCGTDRKSRHAVLIKKNSDDDFTFYDPNYGAVFGLTKKQLYELVTQTFYNYTITEKLSTITRLSILLPLVITSITTAIYGYNNAAIISAILLPVGLLTLCSFKRELQEYDYVFVNVSNDFFNQFNKQVEGLQKILSMEKEIQPHTNPLRTL